MGGPAPTELRLEFRDLTTNMGLHNGFSNTLRWSPMPGAALSTTLLDPLQRPSACNSRALLCKVCQPTPPAERKATKASKRHTCQVCKVDKARDDYWLKDAQLQELQSDPA